MICLAVVPAITSCDDDNKGPNYPDNFAFKQVLRVEQLNNGVTNAFANFIAIDGKGEEVSVQLPKVASITANGHKLNYAPAEEGEINYYAYSCELPGTPQTVTFDFHRLADLTITNTIDMSKVPMVRLPAGDKVENNKVYTYTLSAENPSAEIKIILNGLTAENRGKQYEALILGGGQYRFSGVPKGNYTLVSLCTVEGNLQQQNFTAGGKLEACKVYKINSVNVNSEE